MGSLKVTLCAGVAVVAAVLIPTAYASGEGGQDGGAAGGGRGGGSLSVTPSTPSPGAEVTLKVSGCGGRTATAASDAFVADAQLVSTVSTVSTGGAGRTGGAGGMLVGDTRVRSALEPGTYEVKITCVDVQVKGRIKVLASPASPVAPVRAGGGGAAPLPPLAAVDEARADGDGHGPGTAQTVVGLVLAGVAATVVVFRGMRRRRGAE